jgi:hypothetical protein
MYVSMTEVSRQIGETIFGIDSFTVPLGHAMDDKRMPIMPRAA